MINKINAKTSLDGGGGVSSKPTLNKPGILDIIHQANIVIGSYNNGVVRILKDRYKGGTSPLSGKASVDEVIDRASFIISHAVFGKNDLTIFKEGLSGEIKKAIELTIEKYHKKRG